MKRRLFLGGAAALSLTTPALASTRPLSLSEISRYLNGLKNAKGPFTQVNPDGTLSKGTLYVKLPGRMRFEYTAPNDTLVIVLILILMLTLILLLTFLLILKLPIALH